MQYRDSMNAYNAVNRVSSRDGADTTIGKKQVEIGTEDKSFLRNYESQLTTLEDTASAFSKYADNNVWKASEKEDGTLDHDKVVNAVSNLVNAYNDVVDTVSKNYAKGQGVADQYRSFTTEPANGTVMAMAGLSTDRFGRVSLDEERLRAELDNNEETVKELLGGRYGIASRMEERADNALSDSVGNILSNSSASAALNSRETLTAPELNSQDTFRQFSNFARSGAFNLSNYYAVTSMFSSLG